MKCTGHSQYSVCVCVCVPVWLTEAVEEGYVSVEAGVRASLALVQLMEQLLGAGLSRVVQHKQLVQLLPGKVSTHTHILSQ